MKLLFLHRISIQFLVGEIILLELVLSIFVKLSVG